MGARWRGRGRDPSKAGGGRKMGRYFSDSGGEQPSLTPCLHAEASWEGGSWPVSPAHTSASIPGS